MTDFSDMSRRFSKMEQLERELNLRQLQVNRLLTLTQAINNNTAVADLYNMYNSFLTFELGIKKLALYVRNLQGDEWERVSDFGLNETQKKYDIRPELGVFKELVNIDQAQHPFLSVFEIVIPVLHKEEAIAYVFIGGFGEEESVYEKVQFITTITNIVAVAIENKRLFKRKLEQERMRREMELAAEMQRNLVPTQLPQAPCYQMDCIYQPMLGVGGDYYDFLEFPDGKLAFCVGDISGKGIAAALLMANFQAIFNTLISKRTALDEFVRDLNAYLFRITGGDKFITFFVGEIDLNNNTLTYINAGHNPPIIATQEGCSLLKEGCTILGSFQELPSVQIGHVTLQEPSLILVYTDGLTDIKNAQGEYFDEDKVMGFAAAHHNLPVQEFNSHLFATINKFKDGQDYPDDFTVLATRFCPVEKH